MVSTEVILYKVEIRGCEQIKGKKRKYLLIRFEFFENPTGEVIGIADYDLSHIHLYQRGVKGDLTVKLSFNRYKDMEVVSFHPYQESKP